MTLYEPSLSYAQLSSINIDRLALTNPDRKNKVNTQFLRAKEALQRVDLSILESDTMYITLMMNKAEKLKVSLNESSQFFSDGSNFNTLLLEHKNGLHDDSINVMALKDKLKEITEMRKEFMDTLVKMCFLKPFLEIFGAAHSEEDLNGFFGMMNECAVNVQPDGLELPIFTPDLSISDEELLEQCEAHVHGPKHEEEHHEDEESEPEAEPEGEDEEEEDTRTDEERKEDDCRGIMYWFIYMIKDVYKFSRPGINYLTNIQTLYEETAELVFNDTGHSVTEYPEHQDCKEAITTFNENYLVILKNLSSTMHDTLAASNYAEYADALESFRQQMLTNDISNFTDHIEELEDKCWWMEELVDSHEGRSTYSNAASALSSGSVSFGTLRGTACTISSFIAEIKDHVENEITPTLNLAQQYLDGVVTKLEMSEAFYDMEFTKSLEDLLSKNTELTGHAKSFSNSMMALVYQVNGAFDVLFKAKPPVLSTANLQTFDLLQFANTSSNTQLNERWDTLSVNKSDKVREITKILYNVSERLS